MRKPIGVFDSGIGGLTVAKEIMNILPNEDIVYFGDTARVPYGNKSKETIKKFSLQISRFLETKDVKAIVIACNTASAFALQAVRENFNIPIIGVISPGARAAVSATRNNKIGIIGTEGTVSSGAYSKEITSIKEGTEIFSTPCPLFVPIAEEGWSEKKVSYMIAEEYLENMKTLGVDTLVMGCTHYPLLNKVVQDVMGDKVKLINPAKETALELLDRLTEMDLKNDEDVKGEYKYYVSDNSSKFIEVGERFLNREIDNILEIDIEKY
ncbi:glutamate racemase MurI [Clostridium cylindrosporum DSM 605]|uniref:Glutamate racemase n=2 Tax=Clostridium cylindrosporum TaxID=1495 RepID=A0A0J8DAD6_CLOCY|nr:glutamate racemase MurI [Clostridium cylindrosporum DSM 605]